MYMSKDIVDRSRKYYSKKLKEKVVLHIVKGEYFVEELMNMYNIGSRETIVRWLADYMSKQKRADEK